MDRVRVTRSARKHRIGNAHIIAAMDNAGTPEVAGDALIFRGVDDRGVDLTVVAVSDDKRPGGLAVIHAMPSEWE